MSFQHQQTLEFNHDVIFLPAPVGMKMLSSQTQFHDQLPH